MAGELRTRNAAFLVKIEGTEGVDAAPTAADAILVESVQAPIGNNQIASTEITGSLDSGAPAVVSAPSTWTITARLRGAVGAITALNLPPLDPLLRAAGRSAVFRAAVAATALASGTATSATLATPFTATAQDYRGSPMQITGPNHAGKVAAVTDYTAGRMATLAENYSPVLGATNRFAMPANVVYVPNSGVIPTVTCYYYQDGKLKRMLGGRANVSISMDTAGIPIATITITGSAEQRPDAAIPAGIAPNSIQAPLFLQGSLLNPAFAMDRRPLGLSNLQLDFGNTLVSPPDPNTASGFASGVLTARDTRLTIDPQQTLVATQNVIDDLLAGRNFPFVARAGTLVGNRLQIVVPNGQIVSASDTDREGILANTLEVKANGVDAGVFLAFY
jgi:hypothetical protein